MVPAIPGSELPEFSVEWKAGHYCMDAIKREPEAQASGGGGGGGGGGRGRRGGSWNLDVRKCYFQHSPRDIIVQKNQSRSISIKCKMTGIFRTYSNISEVLLS